MADLLERGYLDRAARRPCVDDRTTQDVTQYELLDADFAQRLGDSRPLDRSPEAWPNEHFFGMIEVGHDLWLGPVNAASTTTTTAAGTTATSRSIRPRSSTGGASTNC